MLMKLTPFANIINVVLANFSYENLFFAAFSTYVLALAENLYKKSAQKTLMKLTPNRRLNLEQIHERAR